MAESGAERAVIGVSSGRDSAVMTENNREALGETQEKHSEKAQRSTRRTTPSANHNFFTETTTPPAPLEPPHITTISPEKEPDTQKKQYKETMVKGDIDPGKISYNDIKDIINEVVEPEKQAPKTVEEESYFLRLRVKDTHGEDTSAWIKISYDAYEELILKYGAV